jgi:poly(hydroxyalkanoate) depolymerase family esterase
VTLFDSNEMAEATRLTRAGRLGEATALIQRVLQGAPQPAADDWAGPTIELEPELVRPGFRRPDPGLDEPGQWLDGAYANPFGRRPYKLYVPANRSEQATPLVVMLHGCTQGPDDFAAGTGMNRLAEEAGFLVVYPGQVETANPSKCWNWFQPTDQERERGEPSLIAGITRQVIEQHGADPARVYVAGLSAGGAQAAIMAGAYPDLYAAVGVHSGLAHGAARDVPSAFAAMRQSSGSNAPRSNGRFVPTIVVHGERDKTVHPGNADTILGQALAGAGVSLEARVDAGRVARGHSYRRTRHETPDGMALVEDWRVAGLGHAWSGGDPRGSYTDPKGPDASRAMVDFFLQYRLVRPA